MRTWLALVMGMCWAALAFAAQDRAPAPPACGSVRGVGDAGVTHGWIVLPDEAGRWVVLHAPPRGEGVADGSLRWAHSLGRCPDAMAAVGNRLFVAYDPEIPRAFQSSDTPRPRLVYSMQAVRAGSGWVYSPQVGGSSARMDSHPAADGRGRMLGLCASESTLFLVRERDGVPASLEVDALTDAGWEPVAVPAGVRDQPGRVAAFAGVPGGVGVLVEQSTGAYWWTVGVRAGHDAEGAAVLIQDSEWKSERVVLPAGSGVVEEVRVCIAGGRLVLGAWSGGDWSWLARELDASGRSPAAGVRAVEVSVGRGMKGRLHPVPLDSSSRVLFVGDPGDQGERRVVEASVVTGDVIYEGPMTLTSPVSRADYVLMGVALAMAVGIVLVMVVGPREGAVNLPEGTSLAEAPRRMLAGLVDVSLAMFVSCRATDTHVGDLGELGWWVSTHGQIVLASAMAGLVLYGSICEWLVGRTLGKTLMGCEVVVTGGEGAEGLVRPSLGASFLRNLIKWGLPPVAILGVLDPSGRHRADQYARTAVVVLDPEDDGEE